MQGDDRYAVGAVETTFAIVEALDELNGAGVTEIANRLDLSTSAVHKQLKTLQQCGYVDKEGTTYWTSLGFLYLGVNARSRYRIYQASKAQIDELSMTTDERVKLTIEEAGSGVSIYCSKDGEADSAGIGEKFPLHERAAGQAILAFLPNNERERILTGESTTNQDDLRVIANRKIAFDRGQKNEDNVAVSIPLLNENDRALGSISVVGPPSHLRGQYLEDTLPRIIMKAVREITIE